MRSPLLCPNLGLFEVALAAEQEEERGVSAGLHLAFGSMDNLPFAKVDIAAHSRPRKIDQTEKGHL